MTVLLKISEPHKWTLSPTAGQHCFELSVLSEAAGEKYDKILNVSKTLFSRFFKKGTFDEINSKSRLTRYNQNEV